MTIRVGLRHIPRRFRIPKRWTRVFGPDPFDTENNWDFEDGQHQLSTYWYVSAPTSEQFGITIPVPMTRATCKDPDTLDVVEGAIISYVRLTNLYTVAGSGGILGHCFRDLDNYLGILLAWDGVWFYRRAAGVDAFLYNVAWSLSGDTHYLKNQFIYEDGNYVSRLYRWVAGAWSEVGSYTYTAGVAAGKIVIGMPLNINFAAFYDDLEIWEYA